MTNPNEKNSFDVLLQAIHDHGKTIAQHSETLQRAVNTMLPKVQEFTYTAVLQPEADNVLEAQVERGVDGRRLPSKAVRVATAKKAVAARLAKQRAAKTDVPQSDLAPLFEDNENGTEEKRPYVRTEQHRKNLSKAMKKVHRRKKRRAAKAARDAEKQPE